MRRKCALFIVISVLILLFSCDVTMLESGENVNEYIFPYVEFTLSEDGTYYTATVVADAAIERVYIPSFVNSDGSSIPVLKFGGFKNETDAKNLRSIVFESSDTSFSPEVFMQIVTASESETVTFSINNIEEDSAVYTDLAVIEKPGKEFEGWFRVATGQQVVNGDRIFPGKFAILEARWKDHELKEVAEVKATCTTDGVKAHYYCMSCNNSYLDSGAFIKATSENLVIPAFHTLTYVEAVEATCLEGGTRDYYRCSVCSRLFSDADGKYEITEIKISPLGHSVFFVAEKEATCMEDGIKEHYECSRCHSLFEDEDAKTEISLEDLSYSAIVHDWAKKQNSGFIFCTWEECTRCAETQNTAEHSWNSGVVVKNATTTEKGSKLFTCTVCGQTRTEDISPLNTAAHSHIWTKEKVVAPTCESEGYTVKKCASCNVQYNDNYTDALGHSTVIVAAADSSCLGKGNIKYYYCSKCSLLFKDQNGINKTTLEEVQKDGEALGHEWNSYWSYDSTSHWHGCVRCDARTDVSAHSYGQNIERAEYKKADATCTEKDIYYYSCRCGKRGESEFKSGSPLGHTGIIKHDEVVSTCEKQGHETYYTCSRTCCAGRYYLDGSINKFTRYFPDLQYPYAHVFSDKYEKDKNYHTSICDKCEEAIASTKKEHTHTWSYDLDVHSWKCEICGYESEKEEHKLIGEVVGERYCECGFYENKAKQDSEGFDIEYIDKEPNGYLEAEQNGTVWTFTLISTNKNAPPESYKWIIDNVVSTETGGTYHLSAPERHSYSIMCVFTANGYYASASTRITGGN